MILQGYHQVAGRFPSEMHCHGPPSPGCASGPRHYCGSTRSGGRSGWTERGSDEVRRPGELPAGTLVREPDPAPRGPRGSLRPSRAPCGQVRSLGLHDGEDRAWLPGPSHPRRDVRSVQLFGDLLERHPLDPPTAATEPQDPLDDLGLTRLVAVGLPTFATPLRLAPRLAGLPELMEVGSGGCRVGGRSRPSEVRAIEEVNRGTGSSGSRRDDPASGLYGAQGEAEAPRSVRGSLRPSPVRPVREPENASEVWAWPWQRVDSDRASLSREEASWPAPWTSRTEPPTGGRARPPPPVGVRGGPSGDANSTSAKYPDLSPPHTKYRGICDLGNLALCQLS